MADNKKNWLWLQREIPGLQQKSILDAENAERLRMYCSGCITDTSLNKHFIGLLAGIGCILIAAGIILFFNYNWDMFSKTTRIAISFLPLLLGAGLGGYTLICGKKGVWREASALITAAGANTAAAMISHIYHTGGTLGDFATLMFLTTFPLMFIFNSRALAFVFPVWLFMSLERTFSQGPNLIALLLFVIYAAYLVKLMYDGGKNMVFARYMTVPAVIYFLIIYPEYPVLMTVAACVLFMLIAMEIFRKNESIAENPWLLTSVAVLVFLALTASCVGGELFVGVGYEDGRMLSMSLVWIILIIMAAVVIMVHRAMNRRFTVIDGVLAVFLGMAVAGSAGYFLPYEIFFSLLIAIWSVYLLVVGCKKQSSLFFNVGMILAVLLLICRFFDENFGVLARAAGFVISGIAFVVANIIFARKIKRARREVEHEEK